jgi:cytochrome c556
LVALGAMALLASCSSMGGVGKGPSGPIGDRQALMQDMKAQAGDVTNAFSIGEEGFDVAMIARSAQQIAADAHRIPSLFPKGSTSPQSRALPAIWTNWSTFTKIADELEKSAFSLQQAALAGDDENLMEKSVKVFKNCKTCHDQFRQPKPKS